MEESKKHIDGLGLYDTMGFGMHREKIVKDVMDKFPSYISWVLRETNRKFQDDALEYWTTLCEEEGYE